jgi:hypothetical protein
MKKLTTLMLGLSLALGSVAVIFAQPPATPQKKEEPQKAQAKKKKQTKKKKATEKAPEKKV